MTALKPPFRYFGGKMSIAPQVAALLPAHRHYLEPFAGSLSVLLAKPSSSLETVNDLDRDIMAFWRVLRDRPAELERVCALTPHSRAEYASACEDSGDELEQARRVWVRLTQGRAGTLAPTGWRFTANPDGGESLRRAHPAPFVARIGPAASRLAKVSLECRPALEVIADYGRHPGVLVYADPPYLAGTRDGGRYRHEMTAEGEHRELAEALGACKAAVVLSGYDSELYAGLYEGWHRRDIAARTGNGGTSEARTEVLWSNRPFSQATLFDLEAS